MSTQPTYSDAGILIALTWGIRSTTFDAATVLGATDHINAGYAEFGDWIHAGEILGQRGLLRQGDLLPIPTPEGEAMVDRFCPSGTPPRTGASALASALASLPIVARPIPPPDRQVIEEAIVRCEEKFKRWQEEQDRRALIPNERDAGILVSMHLGLDTRTDSVESDRNHPRPGVEDWQHIVQAFGRRGLVEYDGKGLHPTLKGERIIQECRERTQGDLNLLRCIVVRATALPVEHPAVQMPSWPTIWEIYRGDPWPWLLTKSPK